VKLATIYAYVSRGILVSHRSADGRRSLFDVGEVNALARRSRTGQRVEGRLATIATSVTELRPEGPVYRGVPATSLVTTEPFERVADLLWRVGPGPWGAAPVSPVPVTTVDDRLRWAVVMSGSVDPLRSDLRDVAVAQAARTIVATMVASLGGPPDSGSETQLPIAERLAGRLVSSPGPATTAAVGAALVLLADHELASSTVAVRIAASTRSDVYDAVLAGLGTVNGPLHGGASRQAHLLLVDAERRGSAAALDDALRWQGLAPGFGHFVYEDGDPRFDALLPLVERFALAARRQVVESVITLAAARGLPRPNIDLGLAALTYAAGMDAEAGGVLFKISRVVGWVAHYLEELTETPLRYRARAVYVTTK
ncbi:MAG TPA: citrate/2-methylcitrate synthase, partial [Acidimicrobiales bacterium]|nr:citrate/2-methylcitrate synthase [Acidimicrobiales bacterium]